MIPSFLITLREVIEASLIVATILGILAKLNQKKEIKTVWLAATCAAIVSVILLWLGSLFGIEVQEVYRERVEQITEGSLMIFSAIFITWAVFFLHAYFAQYKVRLLQKIKKTAELANRRALFGLVFTAVLREGFEVVLFLTTIYFSSQPVSILSGFAVGLVSGLLVSFAFFSATLKMPVYWAFRVSSLLLMLFAAGLLARGSAEFSEAGIVPEIGRMTLTFLPESGSFVGSATRSVFGLTRQMDLVQLSLYLTYLWLMHWWVFVKKAHA